MSDNAPAGTTPFYTTQDVSAGGRRVIEAAPPTKTVIPGVGERGSLTAHLDVRVTRKEHDAIKRRARVLGVKPSTWARAVLRDALDERRHEVEVLAAQASVPRPSPELARAVEQVRRVGVNLNQVVRTGSVVDEKILVEVLAAFAEVRTLLRDEVAL
ncbi:plasmid mobilization protein [Schaalia sp. ZJ405]|uniref:plasmid mobilization protein n=1 Tax=Schaalia sp. ZJ405 TaxID=2709403 RepID=UPI003FA7973D